MITSSWKQHRYTQKYGSVVPCMRRAFVSRTQRSGCQVKSSQDFSQLTRMTEQTDGPTGKVVSIAERRPIRNAR